MRSCGRAPPAQHGESVRDSLPAKWPVQRRDCQREPLAKSSEEFSTVEKRVFTVRLVFRRRRSLGFVFLKTRRSVLALLFNTAEGQRRIIRHARIRIA